MINKLMIYDPQKPSYGRFCKFRKAKIWRKIHKTTIAMTRGCTCGDESRNHSCKVHLTFVDEWGREFAVIANEFEVVDAQENILCRGYRVTEVVAVVWGVFVVTCASNWDNWGYLRTSTGPCHGLFWQELTGCQKQLSPKFVQVAEIIGDTRVLLMGLDMTYFHHATGVKLVKTHPILHLS